MNDNHKKKMIAPVIVTVIFLLYLVIYLLVIMFASEVNPLFLLFAGPLIVLISAWIYYKTRLNVWTVLAVVSSLPGCRSLVNLIMLLPMVYMILFVRNFRSELEKNGVEEFVRKYTPQGTTIKNYDSESTQTSRRDISDFTDGLDSTTNKGRTTVEDSIENHSDTEQRQEEKNSETSEGSTNAKTNSKSSDNSGDGPGYFAP